MNAWTHRGCGTNPAPTWDHHAGAVSAPPRSVQQFEEDDGTVVLELAVAEDDYGKIIGRGGRTANALRTMVKAAAVKEGRRVLVDIVD